MAGTKINYTAVAQFLASYPDEMTLLRFRELSIRNLPFYQAELVRLARQVAQLQQLKDYGARMHPEPEKRVNNWWTQRWQQSQEKSNHRAQTVYPRLQQQWTSIAKKCSRSERPLRSTVSMNPPFRGLNPSFYFLGEVLDRYT